MKHKIFRKSGVALGSASLVFAGMNVSAGALPAATPEDPAVVTEAGDVLEGAVPDGVCSATATIAGAGGAGSRAAVGGNGAEVILEMLAHPTQPYNLSVGGPGEFASDSNVPTDINGGAGGVSAYGIGGAGGDNQGHNPEYPAGNAVGFHRGTGGGGASAFYLGDLTVTNPVAVAGGGGGAGNGHAGLPDNTGQLGGDAGIPTATGVTAGSDGGPGLDLGHRSADPRISIGGGQGGQAAGPGAGGSNPMYPAVDGLPGTGGDGGKGGLGDVTLDPDSAAIYHVDSPSNVGSIDAPGGGGGGYFGGGGGAATVDNGSAGAHHEGEDERAVGGGGGGGGATFVDPTATFISGQSAANGAPSANPGATGEPGYADIDFTLCDYDLQIAKSVSSPTASPGDTVTFSVVVTNAGADHMTLGDTVSITDDVASQFTNAPTNVVFTQSAAGASSGLDQNTFACTGALSALECSQPYSSTTAAGITASGDRGLDVGGDLTITYDVLIAEADLGSSFTNTAGVEDRAGVETAEATVEIVERQLYSIAGTVEEDIDGDGVADTPIAGVTIELHDADGNLIATTVTDADGNYLFPDLPEGEYTLTEIDPDGYGSVSDIEGDNDNSITVTLSGSDATDQDFIDEQTPEEEPAIAFTGAATRLLAMLGAGLVAVGTVLTRRKRNPSLAN